MRRVLLGVPRVVRVGNRIEERRLAGRRKARVGGRVPVDGALGTDDVARREPAQPGLEVVLLDAVARQGRPERLGRDALEERDGARVLAQGAGELGGLFVAGVGGPGWEAVSGGTGPRCRDEDGGRGENARRRVLVHVDVARLLVRLEGPRQVSAFLLQDGRDLLVPVGRLAEPPLLLVQLDRLLQRRDGDCPGGGVRVSPRGEPKRERVEQGGGVTQRSGVDFL